jgi:hypothetical protein
MRSSVALILIFAMGLGSALIEGCGKNVVEGHTRPTLIAINGGAPIHSDVFVVDTTLVSGGYIPQESAEFVFTNPASQKFLDLSPEDPYGVFIIDAYTVRYEVLQELDGGGDFSTPNLPVISNATHIAIPVNTEVTTSLVLAPASLKFEDPIVDLMPGGLAPNGELVIRAEILFTGHEQGSDRDQVLEGMATILFANYADEAE